VLSRKTFLHVKLTDTLTEVGLTSMNWAQLYGWMQQELGIPVQTSVNARLRIATADDIVAFIQDQTSSPNVISRGQKLTLKLLIFPPIGESSLEVLGELMKAAEWEVETVVMKYSDDSKTVGCLAKEAAEWMAASLTRGTQVHLCFGHSLGALILFEALLHCLRRTQHGQTLWFSRHLVPQVPLKEFQAKRRSSATVGW